MADDMREVRVEERLKIKIGEAKHLPARSHGAPSHRDVYCVLSLDQEEIFRTSTMERNLNPFFGEEFQFEVPRRFRYLSIYVYDRDKHLKPDKVLGKVAIKQEELHRYNNKDHWFALRPVDADSEVQGKAHIEISLEDSRKRLRMEPKPPDPDPANDGGGTTKGKTNNLVRLSELKLFGSCSSSTSKKLEGALAEPGLSRSESMKEPGLVAVRSKPPLHSLGSEERPAVDYWSDPERHCAARDPPDTLRLRVLECSELTTKNGQCDPYAIITILYSNGRRVEKCTKPRKKTVNPQFDEIFCFDLVCEPDPKDKDGSQSEGVASEARVSVWHDAASPVFLGQVRLQLRRPAPHPMRCWFFLTSRGGSAFSRGATPPGTRLSAGGGAALGSLRLLLQYTVDHVFPLHFYDALRELFLKSVHQRPISTSAVYILGEIVSSKTDAAQPLVRLFTHHDLIVPIVKELADAEISALTDATTIFRGNTLVSKMMDEAMRLTGASYLRSVLRPTLAAVLADRKPCEIDPARVKPSAAISTNLANLKDYVEKVFSAITSSSATCPATMCRLFEALRQVAALHFPHNAEVRYSVVSGFIFLRFFAPAILGPRLFDLTTEQIDPQTNRTLTLISKTIQSLGNLVSSRSAQQVCKEEYMAELYRSFCTPRHVQAIKQFLEIISTSSDTQNNNVQETPVLLKEGTMIKRSEGVRGGSGPSRRRWTRPAHTHAKRRHFKLTNSELSWSRCGGKGASHKLSLAGISSVAAVDHAPAGAPLGANNIFQIEHRDRVLQVQAGNCVERAEWVRLLSALCKRPPSTDRLLNGTWTCCGRASGECRGCGGGGGGGGAGGGGGGGVGASGGAGSGSGGPVLDPARDLQRLHALLVANAAKLDARSLHQPGDDMTEDEREAEAATLRELREAMFDLEHRHRIYNRSKARETKYGSKQAPIGDDNYLQVAGAGAGAGAESATWAGAGLRGRDDEPYLAMAALTRPARPPRPPRRPDASPAPACAEYELMSNFTSAAPPAVPPRRRHADDDQLLDELARDYTVLHVCEDSPCSSCPAASPATPDREEPFARGSMQRNSNPTPGPPPPASCLKSCSSTSNVPDVGAPPSRALADRLTPFFFKRKSKNTEDRAESKPKKEEGNLIGKLTPRFGATRLERAATSGELAPRPLDSSSLVENLKLLSLHRADWRPPLLPPQTDIRL